MSGTWMESQFADALSDRTVVAKVPFLNAVKSHHHSSINWLFFNRVHP